MEAELPVELWTKVFEHIELDDFTPRPCRVQHYLTGVTEEEARANPSVARKENVGNHLTVLRLQSK
jgi:hypothetical protein